MLHLRAIWFGSQFFLCLVAFSARAVALPAAEGPRLGEVQAVVITEPDAAARAAIVQAGFDVASVAGDEMTLFVTEAEGEALAARGYALRFIEIVPEVSEPVGEKGLGAYHNYALLTAELQGYAEAYPTICRLRSLGQSVQGRELWALLITDNPDIEEDEPEFRYIGSIHGSEPLGVEMCFYFIDRLLTGYETDPRITPLVNETAIWIVPQMNPDGREASTRFNAHGYDLNRSFPKYPEDFSETRYDGGFLSADGREPEVRHIMHWTVENSFVLGAIFHTGALVVNYPYDDDRGLPSGSNAPSPDDALFRAISLRYSVHNGPMYASSTFTNGITNGAAWYVVRGGVQDWSYRYAGSNEVTIELSNIFWPSASTLPAYWNYNAESMLSYLEAVHIGVRGVVRSAEDGAPLWAKVAVADNTQTVCTDPDVGDYHRMLLPGTYDLTFSAPYYALKTIPGIVVMAGDATRVDVALEPEDSDGDGMPDPWEAAHGLNVHEDDAHEDADGDGRTNLEEYQDGTDPRQAGSRLPLGYSCHWVMSFALLVAGLGAIRQGLAGKGY